jgi:hypothetical protein
MVHYDHKIESGNGFSHDEEIVIVPGIVAA